jgi:hypothetical protein
MGATDSWAVWLILRQFDTAVTSGRWLDARSTGPNVGLAMSSSSGTQYQALSYDTAGTLTATGAMTYTRKTRHLIGVRCSAGATITPNVDATDGTPVATSGVARGSGIAFKLGRTNSAASNYQDFQRYAPVDLAITGDGVTASTVTRQ